MAFRRHRSVADASCLSDNGNKWPHDPRAPGWRVRSRAGVGAGGLSPSSSFAGSFIFFCCVDGVPSPLASRPRADGAVLVSRL